MKPIISYLSDNYTMILLVIINVAFLGFVTFSLFIVFILSFVDMIQTVFAYGVYRDNPRILKNF